jgi:hypothetical protein
MAMERSVLTDFRFHDLQHTCASHLAMQGRSLREIQEVLGHKNFGMTLRYAHLSQPHLVSAVESLAGLTPDAATLDRMAHERAQSVESSTEHEVTTS